MKSVRSSQPYNLMNFCTEFSKVKVFPCVFVKSFGISGGNSFTMIFMLDIKYRFTCGESKRL